MQNDESDDDNGGSIIDILLDTAYQDTQVLLTNEREGDNITINRDVQLLLRTTDKLRAESVRSFINDNQYGNAVVEDDNEGGFLLSVTVHMPLRQNLLCSVSALMACLAHFFDIEYDGWSSDLKRGT